MPQPFSPITDENSTPLISTVIPDDPQFSDPQVSEPHPVFTSVVTVTDELKPSEVKELIQICQKKIDEYIKKRGKKIWEHRKKSSGIISGSIRWEVLKRSKGRCEVCGITNDKNALVVDLLIP